jgi:hypothetical protein
MLLHHAYVVDPEVLHELLAAWTAARAAGDDGPLVRALHTAAARRQERANRIRVELEDAEARALAKELALAVEEHLAAALARSRPLVDVQRLRRLAESSVRARELFAPVFLLDDLGGSVVELAAAWRRGDEALRTSPETRTAGSHDLRWLPVDAVSLAMVSDDEQIGLGREIKTLAIARAFRDRYPSAGSFWDLEGTAGPGDALQRYPHPIWNESPLALPVQLEAAWLPVRVSELAGVVSYADAASIGRYVVGEEPVAREFARQVAAAVENGHAVLSWVQAT